ncbi:MAG: hypothetical protein IAE89_13875 [Anaerolineae bacterium]|nr:hypothetical protein [Anaerolineae bacterium]
MDSLTRGGLKPATITNLDDPSKIVKCMFNPFEFSITKSNTWGENAGSGQDQGRVRFQKGGPRSLTLNLIFDTSDKGTDVQNLTRPLWDMMKVTQANASAETNLSDPPDVEFNWNEKIKFRAIIKQLTEQFTFFKEDGTPIRCKITIALQEREQEDPPPAQQPGAAGEATEAGETVTSADNVAGTEGWRGSASASGIDNPLNVPAGTTTVA